MAEKGKCILRYSSLKDLVSSEKLCALFGVLFHRLPVFVRMKVDRVHLECSEGIVGTQCMMNLLRVVERELVSVETECAKMAAWGGKEIRDLRHAGYVKPHMGELEIVEVSGVQASQQPRHECTMIWVCAQSESFQM